MRGYNKTKPLVVHTLQMYRHDRLAYLHEILQQSDREGFIPAFKVVRGAYMEKERARALEYGTNDPIQPDKASTDRDFDLAVQSILSHPKAFLCLGTHNRNSCVRATEWMEKVALPVDSTRVLFAQLLGMSDSLTEELARAGYPVSKYLPYGPVAEVLPYLLRRARENSSASGEISREFAHLLSEKRRRQERQPR
jgi:proline dehydrogenase